MQTTILTLIIAMALLFIAMKVRKSIKGFAQAESDHGCSACGGCCSSGCELKDRSGGESA